MATFSDSLTRFRPQLEECTSAAAALREHLANRLHAGTALDKIDTAIVEVLDAIAGGFVKAEQAIEQLRQVIAGAHDDSQVKPDLIGTTVIDSRGVRYVPPADTSATYLHRPFGLFRGAVRRHFNCGDNNGANALNVAAA